MRAPGWRAWVRVLSPIVMGTTLAAALVPFACRLPNFLVPDDGYFYSQIAYNLGLQGRSTFDGVHATNGYHLPWAFVLAVVSRVIGTFTLDKSVHLFGHLAVGLSLAVATVQRYFASLLVRACALVVLLSTFSLTEMALAAPLMLELLRALAHDERNAAQTRERAISLVLPLVRVDLACVPITAAALLFRRDTKRAAWISVATIAGVLLQLGMMKLATGHAVSVAAWLKANATLHDVPSFIRMNVAASAFVAMTFAAHACLAGTALALRPERRTSVLVIASLSFLSIHTCINVLRNWYWVPSWLGLLFALEQATTGSAPSNRLLHAARASIALVASAFVAHGVRVEIVYAEDQRIAARFLGELRAQVPAGARIFTYDNPGFLGFFSGYAIVDADGLVNDFAYARRFRSGRLEGYLDEEHLCYVIMPDTDQEPVLEMSGLVLDANDVVPLLSLRRNVPSQSDFVLYRLRAPRCAP